MQQWRLIGLSALIGVWATSPLALAQDNRAEPAGAVRAAVPDPARFPSEGWHEGVLDAVLRAEKSLSHATFAEFYSDHEAEGLWIILWCKAQLAALENGSPAKALCQVAKAAETPPGTIDPSRLSGVSIFELAALARKFNPPSCAGFNLTVPLYGIRLVSGGGTEVNGPIEAGLGGGYYWGDLVCKANFSTGPEAFVYSEGLDPSGNFHLGVGAGWQFAAYRFFQFGLAIGYDLYRRTPGTDATATTPAVEATTNGLLAFEDIGPRPSMTFLLTFAIVAATSAGTDGKE